MPLLEGTDGVEKMSKSLDNYIGIAEAPEVMFTKAMQVPDPLLVKYATLCTDLDVDVLAVQLGSDPVAAHRAFARELVRQYHGPEPLAAAERRYDDVARGGMPDEIAEFGVDGELARDGVVEAAALAVAVGFTKSKGEARRLIDNRGLKVDGVALGDRTATLDVRAAGALVLQAGRNSFVRVVWRG